MKKKIIGLCISSVIALGVFGGTPVLAEELTTGVETTTEAVQEQKSISECEITGVEKKTYCGTTAKQTLEVKDGETVLQENVDYTLSYTNAVNVGTATVTVEGIGNYKGTVSFEYQIEKKKIKAKVVLKKKNYLYKKKGKVKPVVVVKDGKTVIPKSNYKVTYPKTKGIGTYTVKVKLKGNYSGTGTAKFNIVPYNTKISRLTGFKGGFSVLWAGLIGEKFNEMTGYEVAYSTDKSFKKKKTKKCSKSFRLMDIRKLKSKKVYYVKIRTFKMVGKKFVYSTWSAKKTVKTK
jgi:hypothetical protein